MSEFYFSAATFHFFWGGVPGGPPRSRKAPPDLASPPPPLPSAESSSSDLASRQTCLGALFSCLKRKNGNGYFSSHLFSLYFWAPTFRKLTLGPSLEAAKGIEKEEKGERKERQRRCVRRPPPPPPRVFPRPLHLLLLLSRWFRFPFPLLLLPLAPDSWHQDQNRTLRRVPATFCRSRPFHRPVPTLFR